MKKNIIIILTNHCNCYNIFPALIMLTAVAMEGNMAYQPPINPKKKEANLYEKNIIFCGLLI